MDEIEREIGVLAEMALGARDLRDFDRAWFEHLRPAIGFEAACSVWTNQHGVTLHAAAVGYSESTLRDRFSLFMGELTEQEVAGFSSGKPALDLEVVSTRRRQQLTVYRELLIPANVSCFTTSVWHSRWGVFGFHLARCKGATRFKARQLEKLARLLTGVKVGQALLAADELRSLPDSDWWVQAWQLSARESDVARLAARGLANPEIARLLRVSPHTVRNQLANVFRKAFVGSRAELVFAMNSPISLRAECERKRRAPSAAWSTFLERGL